MQKKKFLTILTLLLMAVTQGARADETKTVLEDGVFTGFTATAGAGTSGSDGGYDKLVDGSTGNTTAYRYFRLDVSATRGDGYLQLSEFQFMGTTTDTDNITVIPSLSGFGTSEEPFTISSTSDWNLFASKVNTDSKTYSGKYVQLTTDISDVTTKVGTVSGSEQVNAFSGLMTGGATAKGVFTGWGDNGSSKIVSDYNNTVGGSITINGGVVNATGGDYGAGIGGGSDNVYGNTGVCGDIVINGGQVTATGGRGTANGGNAPGVGSGYAWDGTSSSGGVADTYINSGTLTISLTNIDDFFKNSGLKNNKGLTLNSITIAAGKQLIIAGTETTVDNTTGNQVNVLSGKTVWGYNYDLPIALADNDTYRRGADLHTASATYTKTVSDDQRRSWFLPFDYTITAADAENFDFYKIYMIANAITPDGGTADDMWLYVKSMQTGDVLHANMPYIYKAKEGVTGTFQFTTDDALLKAKADDARITMMTAEATYTIYGTYGPTSPSATDQFYYMSANNNLSLGTSSSITVGAFRWIMRVESKFGGGSDGSGR
ncbi:MAG: hypothetical protein IJ200_02775 [Prevotella sp.]|nr:hypothetical protein [Prevotella sp.]